MLKLKQKRQFNLPDFTFRRTVMQLSPVLADDDELTQAIVNDPNERDNVWELSERPDVGALEKFWSEVQTDVQNDPDWFTFSDD